MWSLVAFSVVYGLVLVHDLIFDQVRFAILLAAEVVLTIVGVLGFAIWSSSSEQRPSAAKPGVKPSIEKNEHPLGK